MSPNTNQNLHLSLYRFCDKWDGLGMWRVWVRKRGCIASWWGNRREGDHWGDLGVDGWIILEWISKRWDVGIWIGLAQDRDMWRTLVSAVMNLRVPWNAWNFLTSCKPVSFSRRNLHHGVSKYRFCHNKLASILGIIRKYKRRHIDRPFFKNISSLRRTFMNFVWSLQHHKSLTQTAFYWI